MLSPVSDINFDVEKRPKLGRKKSLKLLCFNRNKFDTSWVI